RAQFHIVHEADIVFPEIFFGNAPTRRYPREETEATFFREHVGAIRTPQEFGEVFLFKVVTHAAEIAQTGTLVKIAVVGTRVTDILLRRTTREKLVDHRRN